ncbi:uncharacterized protein J4E78_009875 [Alternaria triticimaculans]|uniref:uncharacterized protein n=1 Tax=Alternaria triticimaculans TaxID=297637 RepID=UPI0020C1E16B|nr:uncharacterized protein J4E78_009875 [Alternaria triticimaculans]KAI4643406.1 hypothetical protein J4E78_009875 [Alternaria triticimaculans]
MAMSVSTSDKSVPYFPLAGQAKDGFSNNEEATATCFCGAVQLAFPVEGPVDDFNLVETKLKPTRELFVKDRVSWFEGVKGDEVKSFQAML